jgi:hypothetical protein
MAAIEKVVKDAFEDMCAKIARDMLALVEESWPDVERTARALISQLPRRGGDR